MSRFVRRAIARAASSVQLQLLSPSTVSACESLTVGWSGGDSGVDADAEFNLVLVDASGDSISSSAAASALAPVATLGQARVQDLKFRSAQLAAAPGTYIVSATAPSGTAGSPISFTPTSAFVVSGDNTPCLRVNDFASTPSSSTSNSSTKKTSAGIIAGAIVSALVVVLAIVAVSLYCLRKRRRAPVALRPRTPVILPAGSSHVQITPSPTPLPALSTAPLYPGPDSSSPVLSASPSSARGPPPSSFQPPYKESNSRPTSMAVSDDSFVEGLRDEYDAATEAGGNGPRGRPWTSRESSVWSDLPVGPDGMALQLENARKKKSLTFAVSNPDNTVWEEELPSPPLPPLPSTSR
ncbi:hypothetical protein EXIGLDRAFT_772219 [Exidia glandulosa HHB12029]|uniref:Uncharacterized protein n=1 Tax=Exidia glandulosa HHB12029 TaxID=1314781 RepID=A0A165FFT2_EXIGL|nr:hypothetical protein EXIGLDRAFT_772219 [Exidia glandulosa HHB12029]